MLSQAAERFAGIVQDMRQMASEMQRELESPRTELRRGVLEMPQEAAESTSQMRKVIVDQIEALAELNRIVARHGRGLDVASRTRSTSIPREEEPALASIGGRSEPPVRPAAPRARDNNTRDNSNSASNLPPPDLGLPGPRRTAAPSVSPAGADQANDG